MKKIIYIVLVLLISSCANAPSTSKENALDEIIFEVTDSENNENIVLKEKLTRYFDLLKLKTQHPDFEEDLLSQLQSLSNDEILAIENLDVSSIQNIKVTSDLLALSDSVEKIKITYNIVSENKVLKDSIYAYKTNTKIKVDSYLMKSFDIKFSKE